MSREIFDPFLLCQKLYLCPDVVVEYAVTQILNLASNIFAKKKVCETVYACSVFIRGPDKVKMGDTQSRDSVPLMNNQCSY